MLLETVGARPICTGMTLLTAPLELGGSWGQSVRADAAAVIEHMRRACLAGVALLSERQPAKLRVDNHAGSNPSIWLHSEEPMTGWIIVIVGTRDWCNLAYQFGHELGHVFGNSWEVDAQPRSPCQWIEEALVEAFSLRGLGFLADDWERAPPFPNDAAYASAIRSYRETILSSDRATAQDEGASVGFGTWFRTYKACLSGQTGLSAARGAVSTMLDLLENDPVLVADIGALNRWPERSGVPLHNYLDLWEQSCVALNAPGRLPVRLRELLAGP
jgi:hypothetical protein